MKFFFVRCKFFPNFWSSKPWSLQNPGSGTGSGSANRKNDGSGSVIRKNVGSGSALKQSGSETFGVNVAEVLREVDCITSE
jgi:hypothetical protein